MEKFITALKEQKAFHSPKSLIWYYKNILFKNIELKNKAVIDIGGGKGLTSLYCSLSGSSKVVFLEPEADGYTNSSVSIFNQLKAYLNCYLNPIIHVPDKFQNFVTDTKFDIIILNSSINHLEEEACIRLGFDQNAVDIYLALFNKIYSISKPNSYLIITDCSNRNLFNDLKLKNPFDPNIEWQKHQNPRFWAQLLNQCGYEMGYIKWVSFKPLKSIGRILFGNKLCSYFFTSNFILVMIKK